MHKEAGFYKGTTNLSSIILITFPKVFSEIVFYRTLRRFSELAGVIGHQHFSYSEFFIRPLLRSIFIDHYYQRLMLRSVHALHQLLKRYVPLDHQRHSYLVLPCGFDDKHNQSLRG